jgi:hypothetical protein
LSIGFAVLVPSAGDAGAHECDVLGNSPDSEIVFIRAHPDILLFCAACGDKAPTPFHVEKVRAAKGNAFPPQIDITDRAGRTRTVGVSIVYVQLDPKLRLFTNVANRAVCEARFKPHTIVPSS